MRVAVFHNIMWSKYKGGVFSALHQLSQGAGIDFSFTQIAATDSNRVALGPVDLAYHQYPYELIFPGAYTERSVWARTPALVRRVWQTQANLVILPGYERVEFWVMLAVCVTRRLPRAVFCDSTVFDQPQTRLKSIAKRLFFSACDGFFCYGMRSKEYLMLHGVPAEKIFFRCQAAALEPDYSEDTALAARLAQAPVPGAAARFLYVGRLSHEKGLDTLLPAMAEYLKQDAKAKLYLVGAGARQATLEAQAVALGIGHAVIFAGSMGPQALAAEYARATGLILPSTSEPWGLVVNEALSHGCPVIVSDACGCVPELVVEGKTGFAFDAGSAPQLVERMQQLAEGSTDWVGTACRCIEHMRNFSPEKAANQILQGCRKVHDRRSNASA